MTALSRLPKMTALRPDCPLCGGKRCCGFMGVTSTAVKGVQRFWSMLHCSACRSSLRVRQDVKYEAR